MDAENVITAEKLTKQFGAFVAVDHITFSVRRGEIFGFLGANGAGKTTAMRMLTGLSRPTAGSAVVAGFDVGAQPEQVKRHIGYMSQKFSLYDDLTVAENMRLFGGIYGMRRSRINGRIDGMLGWKQKLAFAVATIHEPEIVFLDEPTGGVDPVTRRTFWEQIYRAADRGTTVFVTTHYMDEAEYCDRVSIMVDGRIAALGTPHGLKGDFGATDLYGVFYSLARKAERR